MIDQVSFGKRLRQCRKRKGFSQDEVAERIGVSAQAISKWEKGEVLPDLFHFQVLAQFYRVSADSLLELELDSAERVIETIKVGGAIRNYVMPTYGYKMAENGAQELEVFDVSGRNSGYAYVPVEK